MRKRHAIHTDRIYVVSVNRRVQWLTRLLAVVVLIALPISVYEATRFQVGEEIRLLEAENQQLALNTEQALAELDGLRQQMVNLELASDLDHQVIDQLREQLVQWRERGEQQAEQIQFYLSLMDPGSGGDGVFLDRAVLLATADPNRFRYQVVVGQKSQNHDRVTGSLQIMVHSDIDDSVESLSLGELTDQDTPLALGFKFFQTLEGFVYLPDGFQPGSWSLEFDIRTPVRQSFSEQLDWIVES